ncbi:hypothetical protein CEXT_451321 [Caerostris extrusa]|uniref:Uncharacterized protein n=1 Tax=Caerostris extrusa TaxID=172846 RepID=A0AAV4RTB9_CAEEX|nr:hypothetical protein CEXT_451321 [Caerostris extrusa]
MELDCTGDPETGHFVITEKKRPPYKKSKKKILIHPRFSPTKILIPRSHPNLPQDISVCHKTEWECTGNPETGNFVITEKNRQPCKKRKPCKKKFVIHKINLSEGKNTSPQIEWKCTGDPETGNFVVTERKRPTPKKGKLSKKLIYFPPYIPYAKDPPPTELICTGDPETGNFVITPKKQKKKVSFSSNNLVQIRNIPARTDEIELNI